MRENMDWEEYKERVGSECEEGWTPRDWIGAEETFGDPSSNVNS